MNRWKLGLLIAGIVLILVASFAFSSPVQGYTQAKPSSPSQNMSDTEAFQVLLGIVGLSSVIGGIIKLNN